jgi:hypothetical protein
VNKKLLWLELEQERIKNKPENNSSITQAVEEEE